MLIERERVTFIEHFYIRLFDDRKGEIEMENRKKKIKIDLK